MTQLKGVFAALVFVLAQCVVLVLHPVVSAFQFVADKCAAVAALKLAQLDALKQKDVVE